MTELRLRLEIARKTRLHINIGLPVKWGLAIGKPIAKVAAWLGLVEPWRPNFRKTEEAS